MVALGGKLYVVGGSRTDDDGYGGSDDMFDTMEVLELDPDAEEIPVRPFVGSSKRPAPDAHLPSISAGRMSSGIEVFQSSPFAHARELSSPFASFASSAPVVETSTPIESKGRWTSLSMPYRREGIAVAAFDSKLIIAGGANHNDRYFSFSAREGPHPGKRVHCFDPQEGTWHDLPRMNHARFNASLIEWNGKLLAIGGEEACRQPSLPPSHPSFVDQRSCVDDCETKSKCETQRNQFGATHGRNSVALRSVERYDPVDGTWHEAPPLRAARERPLVFYAKNVV